MMDVALGTWCTRRNARMDYLDTEDNQMSLVGHHRVSLLVIQELTGSSGPGFLVAGSVELAMGSY